MFAVLFIWFKFLAHHPNYVQRKIGGANNETLVKKVLLKGFFFLKWQNDLIMKLIKETLEKMLVVFFQKQSMSVEQVLFMQTKKRTIKMWGRCSMERIIQSAKSLKSNSGGVSFCWIGIQYAMPFSRKYTPSHCFFFKFAGRVSTIQFLVIIKEISSMYIFFWASPLFEYYKV